jgi:hypothetical protein
MGEEQAHDTPAGYDDAGSRSATPSPRPESGIGGTVPGSGSILAQQDVDEPQKQADTDEETTLASQEDSRRGSDLDGEVRRLDGQYVLPGHLRRRRLRFGRNYFTSPTLANGDKYDDPTANTWEDWGEELCTATGDKFSNSRVYNILTRLWKFWSSANTS